MNKPNDDINDILKNIQDKSANNSIGKKKKAQDLNKFIDMNDAVEKIYDKAKLTPSDEIDIMKAKQDFTDYVSTLYLQMYINTQHDETGKPRNDIMDDVLNEYIKHVSRHTAHNQEQNEFKDENIFDGQVADMLSIERKRISDRKIKATNEYANIIRHRYKFNENEDDFTP
jgi:hypothetical protein